MDRTSYRRATIMTPFKAPKVNSVDTFLRARISLLSLRVKTVNVVQSIAPTSLTAPQPTTNHPQPLRKYVNRVDRRV